MIYTLTCNPSVDYALRVDALQPGATNRSSAESLWFGGKGVNVATMLTRLGIPATALGFVAGFTGDALERAVRDSGVRTDFIHLRHGMTRINVKLQSGAETEINARGPDISDDDLQRLYRQTDRLRQGDTLVLAGSVPGLLPATLYAAVMERLQGRGIRFVVDATGDQLLSTLIHRPFLIKPNRAELESVCGRRLLSDADIEQAARELQKRGAVNVLVSLGDDGALLIDEHGIRHRRPAFAGHPVSTVGAGDAMVAGFLAGIRHGYEDALRWGLAAGSATAFSAGLASREAVLALLAAENDATVPRL